MSGRPSLRRATLSAGACLALSLSCAGCPPAAGEGTAAAPRAPRRFGDCMAEVGRRFERLGRASDAGRWELARHDVEELEEVFEEDLPHAPTPGEVHLDLRPIVHAFATTALPPLAAAADARDPAAFDAAFAATATACNGCHQAAGLGFIEVPARRGLSVPSVGPVDGVTSR